MSAHYRNMPRKVRIGCYTYDVTLIDEDAGDIASIYGAHNGFKRRIVFRTGLSGQQLANTFIHEVLHGIHEYMGLDDGMSEENFTTLGANGLCAFWLDNPEAVAWWAKALKS